jgi:photosystem II stability/assembly factor-like uncharacterized protein
MTDTLLLAGTRKGLLLARRSGGSWQTEPLALPMTAVYAVGIDTRRSTPRLFASATSEHWGPTILHSDDLGQTWSEPDHAPVAFPKDLDTALGRVWQIQPGPASEPEVVYAGTEPAALFRSQDGGINFELVRPLWEHPHRPQWGAGFGGQAIHTVIPHPVDPQRVLIALSSGGVYRTFDGGKSWAAANAGIKATFLPEEQRYPEFGQCVHKVAQDAEDPERLYLQNHNGVYRSDDWGGKWVSIAEGLPGEFGFAIVADPNHGGHAYVFPLVSDYRRFTPEFRARVYGTTDAGETWAEVGAGLPESEFYSLVLRDAFSCDAAEPLGLYLGTRSGELYAGGSGGWERVASNLPDVLSVRAMALA